jgi:hypothetical protein
MSESARKLIETLNKQAKTIRQRLALGCCENWNSSFPCDKECDEPVVSVETVTALLMKLFSEKVLVSRKQLSDKKQIIQNLAELTQAETDKILEGFDEDKTTNSKEEVTLRCSYWNNGFIEGLKQARSVFGEAFSQKGSGVDSENKKEM